MNARRRIAWVVAAGLPLLISPAQASDTLLYALEFSRLPVGARTAALGDAGTALPLSALSTWWNPASASVMPSPEAWMEGASLYGDLSRQACGAVGIPLEQQIGVAALYTPFFSGGIPRFDSLPGTYADRLENPAMRADGTSRGYFTNNHHLLILALAKRFTFPIPRLSAIGSYPLPFEISIGCGFKGYWQTMNPDDRLRLGANVNADVGLLLSIGADYDLERKEVSRRMNLGFSLRNALPTHVVWVNSPYQYEEPVHNIQHVGFSIEDDTGLLRTKWILSVEMRRALVDPVEAPGGGGTKRAGYEETFHAGLEAMILRVVSVRAGVSDRVPTLGAGIAYRRFFLDYCFRFDPVAYSPVRLSLGVSL